MDVNTPKHSLKTKLSSCVLRLVFALFTWGSIQSNETIPALGEAKACTMIFRITTSTYGAPLNSWNDEKPSRDC